MRTIPFTFSMGDENVLSGAGRLPNVPREKIFLMAKLSAPQYDGQYCFHLPFLPELMGKFSLITNEHKGC